jgi:hypothetical protein
VVKVIVVAVIFMVMIYYPKDAIRQCFDQI